MKGSISKRLMNTFNSLYLKCSQRKMTCCLLLQIHEPTSDEWFWYLRPDDNHER